MAKTLTIPTFFTLSNYTVPRDILLIGCGGTGAFVVSHLARFMSTLNKPPNLYIVDGDSVEEKNLIRQHFIAQDIGRNKAEVLAERYAAAFGVTINAIDKSFELVQDFSIVSNRDLLIIGCVDNNATRQLIHKHYFEGKQYSRRNTFWVDSGNEEDSGQVVCGLSLPFYSYYGIPVNTQLEKPIRSDGVFSLPSVTEVYPEVMNDQSKFNSELSCAERVISAPQNMMTNVTAATIVMNYVQRILLGMSIASHAVEFSIKNVFSTRLNTKENLSVVNPSRKMEGETHGTNY